MQFRLDLLAASPEDDLFRRARSLAALRAAAEAYGWDARPSPKYTLKPYFLRVSSWVTSCSSTVVPVITSYSIHYTKLYEALPAVVC